MTTTTILEKLAINSCFYRLRDENKTCILAVCKYFIQRFLGKDYEDLKVKISTSTKNPKKKGWHKVCWCLFESRFGKSYSVLVGGEEFEFLVEYKESLEDRGLFLNTFWIKVEKA